MIRNRKRVGLALAFVTMIGAQIVLVGCGEPAEQDPTPVKTWKITPAATDFAQSATPEAVATEPPAGTPSAEGAVLDLVGVGSALDVTELEAPAGPITIRFDNQDAGVVHNLAVYSRDDASEDLLGATELEPGPIKQELKLTLDPGAYLYQCDAHPTTMKGELTVS